MRGLQGVSRSLIGSFVHGRWDAGCKNLIRNLGGGGVRLGRYLFERGVSQGSSVP